MIGDALFIRIFWICVYVLALALIYLLLYYKFDKQFLRKISENERILSRDDKLSKLLNASSIGNIPNLNITTTNTTVETANECGKGPVPINATNGTDRDCVLLCANRSARIMNVRENENIFYQQKKMKRGTYCRLGKPPNCNTRTTDVILTLNSLLCRPKFPELFGGAAGNTVVACNNERINDPLNVLWDSKTNVQMHGRTVSAGFSPDEKLTDGSYRYYCKFNGVDEMHNKYIMHPLKRFHPIRNYCNSLTYGAHPDVRMIVEYDDEGNIAKYKCDCGESRETRLRNIYPDDEASVCAPVAVTKRTESDHRKKTLILPYNCFNVNSPITDVLKMFPCSSGFTELSAPIDTVSIEYSDDVSAPIESPAYDIIKNNNPRLIQTIDARIAQ